MNGNGGNQSSGAGNPGVINGVSSKKQKGSTGKKSDHANSSGVNGANGHKLQSIAPPIEISAANFPPLAPSVPDDNNTPIPTAGYKGPYNKYSLDDIQTPLDRFVYYIGRFSQFHIYLVYRLIIL